jgi:hypothetical protein
MWEDASHCRVVVCKNLFGSPPQGQHDGRRSTSELW